VHFNSSDICGSSHLLRSNAVSDDRVAAAPQQFLGGRRDRRVSAFVSRAMPRRAGIAGLGHGIGAAGLQSKQAAQVRASDVGEEMLAEQKKSLMEKCEVFREKLEGFARKHKGEIVKNPEFRSKFNAMCAAVGVDPLASNKGLWGALGMGDFYYQLGVQMIQVCMKRREQSGGLDDAAEILRLVREHRGPRAESVSMDDLERAVRSLRGIGKSLEIISVAGRPGKMVQSVPVELSQDHTAVLSAAGSEAFTSVALLQAKVGWHESRAVAALEFLVDEGMAWVDLQGGEAPWPLVWFPSLFAPLAGGERT